jgi:hypothetical protein
MMKSHGIMKFGFHIKKDSVGTGIAKWMIIA